MGTDDGIATFEWDDAKDQLNHAKHGVRFEQARSAFADPQRQIFADLDHSSGEDRLFCLGMVDGGVMTDRFTYRDRRIRISGAAYWRKGQRIYNNGRRSIL
jgi:uncharacterized DUF497 family protein